MSGASNRGGGGGVMSKHTPGPWAVNDETWVVCSGDYFIADCEVSHFMAQNEREANARLIAAAPEMMAVLKSVEWVPSDDGLECPLCWCKKGSGHQDDCPLSSVLAKAEGRS